MGEAESGEDAIKAVEELHAPLPNLELDRNQMSEVFESLLVNAIKSRRKGEPPCVHVSAECVDKEWRFA